MNLETLEFTLNNEEETASLAEVIASQCNVGDIITLKGGLGAGKTTFSKYFINTYDNLFH